MRPLYISIMNKFETNQETVDEHSQQQMNPTLVGETMNEEVNDVVTFRTSGEIPEMSVTLNRAGQRLLPIVADSSHSIAEILSRPFLLPNIDLAVNNADYRIWQFAPDEWKRVLHTFYAFTCTYVIRAIINSSPFQTGMCIIWCPPAYEERKECGYTSRSEPFTDIGIRTGSHIVPLASCYPHVVFNLGSTSEAVLKIPFTSIKCVNEKFSVVDQYVRYSSMAPLRGPTNKEQASISLYVHLEDVQLYGTQSGDLDLGPNDLAYTFDGVASETVRYQARPLPPKNGVKTRKVTLPPEKVEAHDDTKWRISDYLSAGSKASAWIAPWLVEVPQLAAAAGAVSWATGVASDCARSLGFSKPFKSGPPQPMVQNPFRNFAHTDAEYTGTKISMTQDSGIEISPLGPVEEDEMNLNYILKRPTFYFPFDWKDDQVPGTVLYQDPMVPSSFFIYEENNVIGQGTVRTYVHTLMSYVTQMFAYWRGSMRFTLNIAANKFYSGRLRAVYVPAAPLPNGADQFDAIYLAGVYADRTSNYHQIIDVRDANTFTLIVPYVSSTHWRHTDRTTDLTVPALFIFVETQLRRTATVADTITTWVSVSAGDDFAVAVPVMPDDRILPWSPGVMTVPKENTRENVVYQGITLPQTGDDTPAEFHFVPPADPDSVYGANISTIGDPVTSLRGLMKRPMPCDYAPIDPTGAFIIDPWSEVTLTGDKYSCDTWLSRIRALYRFSSGSIRIQIFGTFPGAMPTIRLVDVRSPILRGLGINGVYNGGVYTIANLADQRRRDALSRIPTICEIPYRNDLQGMVDIEVPYYHWFDKISNLLIRGNDTKGVVKTIPWSEAGSCPYVILVSFNGDSGGGYRVYKSAADNFNCGYLVAPPITYTRTLPAATTPPSGTETVDEKPHVQEKEHARDGAL